MRKQRVIDLSPERQVASTNTSRSPIAIVGIGCRYPGARGPDALWQLVSEGRCTVTEVPQNRIDLGFSVDRYYDPRPRIPGKISSCKAGFIDHPDQFDPAPFGLTPRDAAAMEPQARMMLEVVWDAIEDAGLPFESLRGERVAVMVGHTAEDFSRERIAVLGEDAAMRSLDVRTAVGFSRAAISGRISHQLDLRGPSLTLDTACSSSLYATHLACQSLWSGESKLALAGGVNLFLTPEGSLALSRSGMMASDGKCKAFDARADGFVRAEGAGVVLLRPLQDALANGDSIYAVIRGTGTSADGRDGGHMMAPGRAGQAQAMRDAYRMAGFPPSEIDFVEAHGTGTTIGDPVEIGALADVMSEGRATDSPLRVSSIKGNIGHTESASGVAGLIKAALAIKNRVIPAQLHFETPNPQIDWDGIPVKVQDQTIPWPHDGVPRAGVNSFGISGTNAHVVLEGAPSAEVDSAPRPTGPWLLPFTAHDPAALTDLVALHLERLSTDSRTKREGLSDLAFTLSSRRSFHSERLAVVADSQASFALELERVLADLPSAATLRGHAPTAAKKRVVFVFPGQGGQWVGMARELILCDPVFRQSIQELDLSYRKYVDWSLTEVLSDVRETGGPLERLSVLQPALIAVQIALAEWLAHYGVKPDAVLGQSVGEVAAAAIAGILDRDEVSRLACARGQAVERVAGKGAMGMVALPEAEVREALVRTNGCVEIAGVNAPAVTLIAGDKDPLHDLVGDFEVAGVFARILDVDFASHCFHMDPLLDDFAVAVGDLSPSVGLVPFYSTVTGTEVSGDKLNPRYWQENLRRCVRFSDAIDIAIEPAATTFIEISPHPTLKRSIDEIAAVRSKPARHLECLRKGHDGRESMLQLLAALFVEGHPVDVQALAPAGNLVATPLYPYQRQTLWFGSRRRSHLDSPKHLLLGPCRVDAEDPGHRRWHAILDIDTTQAFALTERNRRASIPASFCIEIALAVSAEVWPDIPVQIEELRFEPCDEYDISPSPGRPQFELQARLKTLAGARGEVQILARRVGDVSSPWRVAAEGVVAPQRAGTSTVPSKPIQLETVFARCDELALESVKATLARTGAPFPRRVDGLRTLHVGHDEFIAKIEVPTACQNDRGHFYLHPTLMEMGVALAGCVFETNGGEAFAQSLGRLELFAPCGDVAFIHGSHDTQSSKISLSCFDDAGTPFAQIKNLIMQPLSSEHAFSAEKLLYRVAWAEVDGRKLGLSDEAIETELAAGNIQREPNGTCLARRLVRIDNPDTTIDDVLPHGDFAASIEFNGEREGCVEVRSKCVAEPRDAEIRVRVQAATLNKGDLRTMLLSRGRRGSSIVQPIDHGLGRECAGIVTAVGKGVTSLQIGDAVVGLALGTVASEVITRANWMTPLPALCEFAEAASLPLALITAERALFDIARVRPGDRVVLLSLDDGIDFAAASIAQRAGAHVFAVSPSKRRRDALVSAGVECVASSSGTSWCEAIQDWSQGAGADVVVSAAGDLVFEEEVAVLAAGGHFIDLRPQDGRMRHSRVLPDRNCSVTSFDIEGWLAEHPDQISPVLTRALANWAEHRQVPVPSVLFPIGEVSRALRYAAQDRAIAKIAIDLTAQQGLALAHARPVQRFDGACLHWISGPTIQQIETQAGWLGACGARRFVVHPTRALGDGQAAMFERLKEQGYEATLWDKPMSDGLHDGNARYQCVVYVLDDTSGAPRALAEEIVDLNAASRWADSNPGGVLRVIHCADDIFASAHGLSANSQRDLARDRRETVDALCRDARRRGANIMSIGIATPPSNAIPRPQRTARALSHLAFVQTQRDCIVIPSEPESWQHMDDAPLSWVRHLVQATETHIPVTERVDVTSLNGEKRRAHIQQIVEEQVANVLALGGDARARLDHDTPLIDLGLDSLLARELVAALENDLNVGFPLAIWTDRPSLKSIVDGLENEVDSLEKDT